MAFTNKRCVIRGPKGYIVLDGAGDSVATLSVEAKKEEATVFQTAETAAWYSNPEEEVVEELDF